jgi:hypothetical protein
MTQMELDVRRRAKDYVEGRSALADFGLWLAGLSWGLDEEADPELRELVSSIELKIAEFSSTAWNESELKHFIRVIAISPSASTVVLTEPSEAPQEPTRVETSSHSETCNLQLAAV